MRLLPHRIVGAVILRARFSKFASTNGLVYFGLLLPSDNHETIRGFTAHTGQVDSFVIHGSVHGREVTILERTVTHTSSPSEPSRVHTHTWLIAAVKHGTHHAPELLLLSHTDLRLQDEAAAFHSSKSEVFAIDNRLEAEFHVYAKPASAQAFKDLSTQALIDTLITEPSYDYEFDADSLYLYSNNDEPTMSDLNRILKTALLLAESYDTAIEKSPL